MGFNSTRGGGGKTGRLSKSGGVIYGRKKWILLELGAFTTTRLLSTGRGLFAQEETKETNCQSISIEKS